MKRFYLITLLLLISRTLSAAQKAYVIVNKAVIYSDPELKSPIGFVRRGKQLPVGEVKRKRGSILPVAINGQVAWIQVGDISLEKDTKSFNANQRKVTEHKLEGIVEDKKDKDPLDQNNYFLFRASSLSATINAESVGGEDRDVYRFDLEENNAASFSFLFEHKNPYSSWHWGVGLDFINIRAITVDYQILALRGQISYVPFVNRFLTVEAFSSLLLSAGVAVDVEDIGRFRGGMIGAEFGGIVRLFPQSKIGVVAGASLILLRFSNLDDIPNSFGVNQTSVTSATGAQAFLGLNYRF